MTAILIASLLLTVLAGAIGLAWLGRRTPAERDFPSRVIEAISGRPGGALVLFEGAGLDPATLSEGLLGPHDEVLAGDGRFAVRLNAPGRDADFARWLCRAQVALEGHGGTVRIGATRTGPSAWPEEHLARAERALARATSDDTAVAIDDHATPQTLAAEAAATRFAAVPILCAEQRRLVAVEPVASPEVEGLTPASPEAARLLFLARLKSGAGMLSRHDDHARLSLPLPDDLAGDPQLHLALVFALDGCDIAPERVTLRIGATPSSTDAAALAATGCTISTAVHTPDAIGCGPHWLPAALVRDMDTDESARRHVAGILAQATKTGAEVLARDVGTPETAHMLAALGCTLVSGPGVAPPLPERAAGALMNGTALPGSTSGG